MPRNYWIDEEGAVTVDWVVLTAAIVGLGIAGFSTVSAGVENASGDVETVTTDFEISTSFGSGFVGGGWTASTGSAESLAAWVANFADDQLLAHMNNMDQYKDMPAGSGHPYDTYHDEYWVSYDEAGARGLL
jgi:Flp pilus assembly pilin Flp